MPEISDPQQPVTSQSGESPDYSQSLKELCEAAKIDASAASKVAKDAEETQKQIAVCLGAAQKKLDEISGIATQAVAAGSKITDQQAVIVTKSDHIQNAQDHADKVRGELDRALTSATQQVTAIEGQKNSAQASAESAASALTSIQTTKGTIDTAAAFVVVTQKEAETSAALTKGLADKATMIETRVSDYEKRLAEIDTRCEEQLKTIDGLLRGATSAGLATAFDNRRQTFLKPNSHWQWIFVGALLFLVAIAFTGLWHIYQLEKAPEWDELARLWLSRLPIAGALIWLALHASREAALAKRLEEDYGYKAAIASCFEGFRTQMAEVDTTKSTSSQLAKLCENTLATIASPPGRIYDAHKLVVSPTEELTEVAKAGAGVAKEILSPKS